MTTNHIMRLEISSLYIYSNNKSNFYMMIRSTTMMRVRMIQMRSLSVLFLFFSPSYLSQLTSWEEHSYSRCGRDGHSQTGSWCMVVILRQVVGVWWSFLDRQLVYGGLGQVKTLPGPSPAARTGQRQSPAARKGYGAKRLCI